ncbi:putative CRISPR-associated protein [Thermosipho melanesiensis]|uniref:CRISPR-associated protein n=2 Tax=Thermosipho melanesiensis TaxID=46541 RepID=A0ABN4UX10_9BACT|nr:putative CRISPR-associated protein [Thermosipho melanesiensis]ABR31500.1 putative CRISPR-associated protein, APE2256 family [Thermosipho melanesiensis BI429]APT74554.1 CRISPR-associated protein [Thermosipho melanesiensis]
MKTLINTVGASLINNLQKIGLKEAFENGEIDKITKSLLEIEGNPENLREFGAEINSIVSIIKKGYLTERKNLYFLVSDTDEGKKIGEILKGYFENIKNFNFEKVTVCVIEKLNDARPYDFKIHGLRNLIKKIAEFVRKHYGEVIINATGGYKAQIAFALALGQTLKVPVYYRFERFPEVIELEPLPLDLDKNYYFLARNLFEQIDNSLGKFVEFGEVEIQYKILPVEAKIFFDIEKIDGKKYLSISPMGQIYLESIRSKFYFLNKEIQLEKRKGEIKFISSGKEGHSIQIINNYSLKDLFERFKYITSLRVTRASQSERTSSSKVKIVGNKLIIILHTKKGLIHFEAETTARNEEELEIIRLRLEEFLDENFDGR